LVLTIQIYDFLKKQGPQPFKEIFLALEKTIDPDRATRVFYNSLNKAVRDKVPLPDLEYRLFFGKKKIIFKLLEYLESKGHVRTVEKCRKTWTRKYEATDRRPLGLMGGTRPRKTQNCIGA